MPQLAPRLRRLEKLLDNLPLDAEAMLLGELDGYLAGILVCPDLIMPGEWMPAVWGGGEDDSEPVFEDMRQVEQLTAAIMEHYNATSRDLLHGRFAPIYHVDERHDETLWELWIDGFERAMDLRPESWDQLADSDDAQSAFAILAMLAAINRGDSGLPQEKIDTLIAEAPDLIPDCIQVINAWRLERDNITAQKPQTTKVGRNDPCPCGSGKKYKKCCGAN